MPKITLPPRGHRQTNDHFPNAETIAVECLTPRPWDVDAGVHYVIHILARADEHGNVAYQWATGHRPAEVEA